MTCEEHQRYWNGLLDSRDGRSPSFVVEWDAHVDSCERCRSVSAGCETLREAIDRWPAPEPASAASLARLRGLGARHSSRMLVRTRVTRTIRIALPVGLAASAALIAWIGSPGEDPPAPRIQAPMRSVAVRSVLPNFGGAERATRELALEAAGPAARIGRDVLGLDLVADISPASQATGSAAETPKATAQPGRSTEGRAQPGTHPFPESARHAFSFLLGPEGLPPSKLESGL